MVDLSRRRMFGLLAAPAIVSITGKVHAALWTPEPFSTDKLVWRIKPTKLIVAQENEIEAANILRDAEFNGPADFYQRFRSIVEPCLREYFDEVYKGFNHDAGRVHMRGLRHARADLSLDQLSHHPAELRRARSVRAMQGEDDDANA